MESFYQVYALSMKDILKNSWKLFTENIMVIIAITLVIGLPISIFEGLYEIFISLDINRITAREESE